jgi:Xaa-Pro aminopeptidase
MDENWLLMKSGLPDVPSQCEWLQQNLETGSVIGVDPLLIPISQWNDLKSGFEKSGHRLVS